MIRMGLVLLVLAGCGSNDASAPPEPKTADREASRPAPVRPDPAMVEEGRAAAAALRRYYELIGSGRFREAWQMRAVEPGATAVSYEAFARHYGGYAVYRATVGVPRPAVEAGGRRPTLCRYPGPALRQHARRRPNRQCRNRLDEPLALGLPGPKILEGRRLKLCARGFTALLAMR
jgi:hypothetical protein